MTNIDHETVAGFGAEWKAYDQSYAGAPTELAVLFAAYFSLFPWSSLPPDAVGFDAGCGSGRWARFVAPKVGLLHCVDASADALAVARRNLTGQANCAFHNTSVEAMPFPDGSMDFGYSLGVLHHVPDTGKAIADCARKLKPGAPFLLYLYYSFDNRPAWYGALWRLSELGRLGIARLPFRARYAASLAIALAVYWPLARSAAVAERLGIDVRHFPLSAYRQRSLYNMRTNALDRFGTKLEQRFSKAQIRAMMQAGGLRDIEFAEHPPYWCAIGYRA